MILYLKQFAKECLKHISHAYTMSKTKLSQQSEMLNLSDATRQERKLSDEFMNSIDPKDIAELKARAEKVEHEADTYYEIKLMIPFEGAVQFLEAYEEAMTGDMMAIMNMLFVVGAIAESLKFQLDE
jgi:hypothetical protein